jgi:thiamine-monophosphate kinase
VLVRPDRIRPEGGLVISVSDDGEFGVIARIISRLPSGPGVLLGPGDDAAVVSVPDGRVVASTDLLVEGRHFRRDWSSAYDIGRKAAAQNLADIVAMGARPVALLVGLACPGDLPVAWVEDLADGLREESALIGASVVGGDVSAADSVTLAVTALGDLEGREPVTRSGARPGDQVVVAGRLGTAAAGLALASEHGARAMIDVSDGLIADLGNIAEASGVRIELTAAELPVPTGVAEAATSLGVDPLSWVAGGGDDHAFVAMLPPGTPHGFAVIGRVVAGVPGVVFTDAAPLGLAGHEHFRS